MEHQAERAVALKGLEDVVNNLKARNTVGKLNKVDLTQEQLVRAADGKKVLEWVEGALAAGVHISDAVGYLREAVDVFGPDNPASVDANSLRGEILELFRSDVSPDAAKVAALKARAEDLRRRFSDAAVSAHERDRLGGTGDERKRHILEGPTYADLGKLSAIELLPGGKYASLQQKLAELHTCKSFDPNRLMRTLTCPECNYRPRPAGGPSAQALLGQLEEQVRTLRSEWEKALLDSLTVPEMTEQIDLLKPSDNKLVTVFIASGELPEPVTENFVSAVSQVLTRFEVRRVAASDIWAALFPESAPATIDELGGRFKGLLDRLIEGASADRVRVVPAEEPTS